MPMKVYKRMYMCELASILRDSTHSVHILHYAKQKYTQMDIIIHTMHMENCLTSA